MKEERRGITLIALVITIIILLILAGITISLTIGQRGILNRAQEAGKNYQNSAAHEEVVLSQFNDEIDDIINNITEDEKRLKQILNKYTIEDIMNNKDDILRALFENKVGTEYIMGNYLEEVTSSTEAMSILGESKYAAKETILNSTWRQAVLNSTYVDEFDKGSITTPTMSANSDNGYEAYSPSENNFAGGQLAYCAFDGRNTSASNSSKAGQYMSAANCDLPTYVQLVFPNEITIYKIKLYFYIDEGTQPTSDVKGNIEMGSTKINFETVNRPYEKEIELPAPIISNYIKINFESYNWYSQSTVSECVYYAR